MKRTLSTGVAAVAVGALLAGCGGGGPSSGSGKVSDDKIVLGVLTDLSGIYADIAGPGSVEAVQMAVDDFKKKYGDKAVTENIEVIKADHQNKPEVANTQAREMYDRKRADALFDVPTSSAALAVATVAQQSKRLYFNTAAATTELAGKSCNPYTYEWAYDAYMLAQGTGAKVTEQGGKNWYMIYPDYAFGQDMQAKFTTAVQGAGGTVVAKDPTPFPSDNYSTFLLKAPGLKPKPDVLGALQAGGDLANVVKQYEQFKLKDKGIELAIGLLFDSDIKAVGADKLAGTMFTTAWYWNLDDDSRAWADRFKERTGQRPTFDHAADYSAATHYLEAVQKAGTDKAEDVSKKLDGMKFNDFFARNATLRAEDHRVVHDAYLVKVKDPAKATEDGDFTELVDTIPADEAFDKPSPDCRMN
ncbi:MULTISPECIES: ABC transporter substrate-binding protein [Streptomyces]|uniref:Branched-chain amino acid ABC transporter substrate-binding protein n=1 Tax=Streptomyces dengpaensis TaxID=2049881 RepID=A0ABM6SKY7_9ACTN|nr:MULTISPECIES: ABC transporter substrate-binding protein [Streptomyces]AVH55284.1 branched-chain amino acid ABC transporter substrate-binding protein [Streptomyces dengpaensis]PIB07349.1 branched-chain amino acid ABC transporter substrate-binding protein [Streptomyces sp. HG99]